MALSPLVGASTYVARFDNVNATRAHRVPAFRDPIRGGRG